MISLVQKRIWLRILFWTNDITHTPLGEREREGGREGGRTVGARGTDSFFPQVMPGSALGPYQQEDHHQVWLLKTEPKCEPTCLCFLSPGIQAMHHYVQLKKKKVKLLTFKIFVVIIKCQVRFTKSRGDSSLQPSPWPCWSSHSSFWEDITWPRCWTCMASLLTERESRPGRVLKVKPVSHQEGGILHPGTLCFERCHLTASRIAPQSLFPSSSPQGLQGASSQSD